MESRFCTTARSLISNLLWTFHYKGGKTVSTEMKSPARSTQLADRKLLKVTEKLSSNMPRFTHWICGLDQIM